MNKTLKLVVLVIAGILLIACAVFSLREQNRQKEIEKQDYLTLEPGSKIYLTDMERNELPQRLVIMIASGVYRPEDPDIAVLDEVASLFGDGLSADYLTLDDSYELHFAYHSDTERYVLSYYNHFSYQLPCENSRLVVKTITVRNKNTYVNIHNQEIRVNPPDSWITDIISGVSSISAPIEASLQTEQSTIESSAVIVADSSIISNEDTVPPESDLPKVPDLEYEIFHINESFAEELKSTNIHYGVVGEFFAVGDYILFYTVDSSLYGKSHVFVQLPDDSIEPILSATQSIKRMYIVDNKTIGIDFIDTIYFELAASTSFQLDLESKTLCKVEKFFQEAAYDATPIIGEWYLLAIRDIQPVMHDIYITSGGEKILKAERATNINISNDIIYYTVLDSNNNYKGDYNQIFSLNKEGVTSNVYSIAGDNPQFNVYRNKIIYANNVGVFIYDMKTNTEIKIEGLNALMWDNIYLEDGFYSNSSKKLYFVAYDGAIDTILNDFIPHQYWIVDNWLYYCQYEEDVISYYRVNLNNQVVTSLNSAELIPDGN